MREAAARRATQGHGSGVYKRGNVFWLKVRTPASLANHLSRSFWRSSLRTTSRSEAQCAARSVRAALDQGFAAVGVGMRLGVLTAAQGEAVIVALVRKSLAEAESRRTLAGPRGEDAIDAARNDHLVEAAAWRDVLRRNDLAMVAPLVAEAAGGAGLAGAEARFPPELLREAARTLVAVAEENAAREDGLYAGDRGRLLERLDAAQPGRAATHAPLLFAPIGAVRPNGLTSVGAAPLAVGAPTIAAEKPAPDETPIAQEKVASSPVGVAAAGAAVLPTVEPTAAASSSPEAAAPASRPAPAPAASATEPTAGPMVEAAPESAVAATDAAKAAPAPQHEAVASTDPIEPVAPRQRRRQAPRRAERRPVRSEETERLRRLAPEQYLDLTLEEGFALMRDISSKGGTDASWMRNSVRGFDAAGTLALSVDFR